MQVIAMFIYLFLFIYLFIYLKFGTSGAFSMSTKVYTNFLYSYRISRIKSMVFTSFNNLEQNKKTFSPQNFIWKILVILDLVLGKSNSLPKRIHIIFYCRDSIIK